MVFKNYLPGWGSFQESRFKVKGRREAPPPSAVMILEFKVQIGFSDAMR